MNKNGTGPHILIVEDDSSLRDLFSEALRSDGFTTSIASDGVEGIEVFDETNPDLVLLDLLMPKMGGIDVLEALQGRGEAKPTSKIVVLSALVEPYLVEKLHALGAYRVLTKPFHVDELLRMVEEVSQGTG